MPNHCAQDDFHFSVTAFNAILGPELILERLSLAILALLLMLQCRG